MLVKGATGDGVHERSSPDLWQWKSSLKIPIHTQGWGLLSQFTPFHYFPNFSALSKHRLAIEYHVYILHVSPQPSCSDTCKKWMWFKEYNRYVCKIENLVYGEINEWSFSTPHPRSYQKMSTACLTELLEARYNFVICRTFQKHLKLVEAQAKWPTFYQYNCNFSNINYDNLIQIGLKFVPKGPIDNMSGLV